MRGAWFLGSLTTFRYEKLQLSEIDCLRARDAQVFRISVVDQLARQHGQHPRHTVRPPLI